jgi:hypothetical protein
MRFLIDWLDDSTADVRAPNNLGWHRFAVMLRQAAVTTLDGIEQTAPIF